LTSASAPADAPPHGTRVSFRYDDEVISKTAHFDPDTIRSRLRELAFLNPTATIHFRVLGEKTSSSPASSSAAAAAKKQDKSKRNGSEAAEEEEESDEEVVGPSGAPSDGGDGWEIFHFEGGLAEYVAYLNASKQAVHSPLCFSRAAEGGVHVEVALQWCSDSFSDTLVGFVNSIKTVDGGTHIDGLKAALTRTGAVPFFPSFSSFSFALYVLPIWCSFSQTKKNVKTH
jgi:DNA gyrase subunit B